MTTSDSPADAAASGAAAASAAVVATSGHNGGATAAGTRPPAPKAFVRQQVPDRILCDEALNAAVAALPPNYNFEIHKTVWRTEQAGARNVALQFPEGLLMYACVIADVLERFVPSVEQVFILGDVTFGACCVDDFSAAALGADLLVHYGHSCLVPVSVTSVPCMYVFVDIAIDVDHLVGSVELGFEAGARLALAGTIQFASAVQLARQRLSARHPSLSVPKCRPLSPGEVLGCTAPVLPAGSADAIVFVADGRFHLEAIMIANPGVPAYRYDPYARVLTRERYDHGGMRRVRRGMVERAQSAARWGLVLGTLGRQGNPALLARVEAALRVAGGGRAGAAGGAAGGKEVARAAAGGAARGRGGGGGGVCGAELPVTLLMSEVSPARLAGVANVDAFVQVACPRLSIDWGEGFERPTLTPFEALVALGAVPPWWEEGDEDGGSGGDGCAAPEGEVALRGRYPMDYYAKEGGAWKSSWH